MLICLHMREQSVAGLLFSLQRPVEEATALLATFQAANIILMRIATQDKVIITHNTCFLKAAKASIFKLHQQSYTHIQLLQPRP